MTVVPLRKRRVEESVEPPSGFATALKFWRSFAHRRELVVASPCRLVGAERTFLGESDEPGSGPKDFKLIGGDLLFEDLPVSKKERAVLEEIADTLLEMGHIDIKDLRAPENAQIPVVDDMRGHWDIMLTDNQRIGIVVRSGEGARKHYKMFMWWEGKWKLISGPPCFDVPVFGLPELRRNESLPVMIHEGPKSWAGAVEAGRQKGGVGRLANFMSLFAHIGWHGSDIGMEWTDWSVLRGRRVLIWPDMDEQGLLNARALARKIARMGGIVDYVQWSVEDITGNTGWDWGDTFGGTLLLDTITRTEIKNRVQRIESPVNVRGVVTDEWCKRSFYDAERQEVYMESRGYKALPLTALRTEFGGKIGSAIANSGANPFLGTDYRPGLGYGRMKNGKINLAPPNPREPMKGRPLERRVYEQLVRGWLRRMVPDPLQRKHLIRRMAWAVARPEKVPHHMVIMQGDSGIGKSVLMDLLTKVAGLDRSVSLFPDAILGRFNALIGNKGVVCIHEIHSDEMTRKQNAARLKELVANETIMFEEKNRPKVVHTNVIHWFAATNEKVPFAMEHGNDRFYFVQCANPVGRKGHKQKDWFFRKWIPRFEDPLFLDQMYAAAKWLCANMGPKHVDTMTGRALPQKVWKSMASASKPAWIQRLSIVLQDIMEQKAQDGENHPPVFYGRLVSNYIHDKYRNRGPRDIEMAMNDLGFCSLQATTGAYVSRREKGKRHPIWCRMTDALILAKRGDFGSLIIRKMEFDNMDQAGG